MNRRALGDEIGSARESLAEDLRSVRDDRWDVSSLCAGWRIRDVVAHLVLLDHYECAPWRWVAGVVRAGLRPNRFMAEDARRLGTEREARALVEDLDGSEPEQRWIWRHHPAPEMLLGDFVIHGMDVRRPLRIPDRDPLPRVEAVADLIVRGGPRVMRYPLGGWKRPGVRCEATDADWAWGEGPLVRGPLASIVLVLAGRVQALTDLEGDGVRYLASS